MGGVLIYKQHFLAQLADYIRSENFAHKAEFLGFFFCYNRLFGDFLRPVLKSAAIQILEATDFLLLVVTFGDYPRHRG